MREREINAHQTLKGISLKAAMTSPERQLEQELIDKLRELKYFANSNAPHIAFDADKRFLPIYEHAKPDNTKVRGLHDFADAFLAKCTLGHTISRYMVLVATEQKLLMMRPYQIYAVKNLVGCIGENRGNGYVWHTTDSGKTELAFLEGVDEAH